MVILISHNLMNELLPFLTNVQKVVDLVTLKVIMEHRTIAKTIRYAYLQLNYLKYDINELEE